MIAFPPTRREIVEGYLVNPVKRNAAVKFACRLTRNMDTAEDAVQEASIKAWKNAECYDQTKGSITTWFCTIIAHEVTNQLRRRITRREDQIVSYRAEFEQPSTDGNPLRMLITQEIAEVVGKAIENLPEKYRLRVFARFFDEMSYRAMAEIFESNERTEKYRTDDGIERLKQDRTLRALVA